MLNNTIEAFAFAINNEDLPADFSTDFKRLVLNGQNNAVRTGDEQAIGFMQLYKAINPQKRDSFLNNSTVSTFLKNNAAARFALKGSKITERNQEVIRKVVALEVNPKLNDDNRQFLAHIIRGNSKVVINSSTKNEPMTLDAFRLLNDELPASNVTELKIEFSAWNEDLFSNTQSVLYQLTKNKSIKILDLSGNSITNKSASNIANIISSPYSKSLEVLNLSNTRVCLGNGAETLARSMRFSEYLKSLNLSNSSMSDASVKQLATAFVLNEEEQAHRSGYPQDLEKFSALHKKYNGEPNNTAGQKPKEPARTASQKEEYKVDKAAYEKKFREYYEDKYDYDTIKAKYGLDKNGNLQNPAQNAAMLNTTLEVLDLSNNKQITDASLPAIKQMLDNNKNLKIHLQDTGLTQAAIEELKNSYGDRINLAPVAAAKSTSARTSEEMSARATDQEIFLYNSVMKEMHGYLASGNQNEIFMESLQLEEYQALPAAFKTKMIDLAIRTFKDCSPPAVAHLADKRLLAQMNDKQFQSLFEEDIIVFGKKIVKRGGSDYLDVQETEALLDTKNIENMSRQQIYLLFKHINTPENRARLEALPRKNPLGPNDDPKRGATRWSEVLEAMKDRVFECTLEGTENNREQKAKNLVDLAKNKDAQELMGTHATSGWHLRSTDSYNKLQVIDNTLIQGDAVDYAQQRAGRAQSHKQS